MRTANTVLMAGDLEQIVTLAGDVERWPVILPHYRWVTLLDGGGDEKTVEMAARRGRIPVRWRAIQRIARDGATPVIHYRHIRGVTRGMVVAWTFAPGPEGVRVRIDHEFSPSWPLVGDRFGDRIADHVIGPSFVEPIASRTLATIKAIVEDRDPRFDTRGRPRS